MSNCPVYQRNKSIFVKKKKKKIAHSKVLITRKIHILTVSYECCCFHEIHETPLAKKCAFMKKEIVHLKNLITKESLFQHIVANFADFQ